MSSSRFAAPLLALAALAFAPIAHAQTTGIVSYKDIADTFPASPFSQLLDNSAVNNFGQVAFNALTTGNVQHLYLTPRTGSTLLNISSNPSPFPLNPDVNDLGTVAFPGFPYSGPSANIRGVYTGSGGAVATVADATTPGHPNLTASATNASINNSGSVVFVGYGITPGGVSEVILAQPGGTFTSVAQVNNGQFAGFVSAVINNTGQVAFSSNDYTNGNENGAFVYRYDPATLINTKVARIFSNTVSSLNDAGTLAYEGANSSKQPVGIYTNGITGVTTIAQFGQTLPGTNILITEANVDPSGLAGSVPINNRGQVAFLASNGNNNQGIYLGDGTNTITIVRIGDVLFGTKTVTQLQIGNQGLNDNGQVVFRATLRDTITGQTSTAIVLGIVPAPEPSQYAAFAIGLLGLGALAFKAKKRIA